MQYSKASDVKKDLNERFKGRFPTIELTLSKLRSLKRELYHIAVDHCSLEVITVAYAYVYFEKLILKVRIIRLFTTSEFVFNSHYLLMIASITYILYTK